MTAPATTFHFEGGPKHGQAIDLWPGIEWLQVYRPGPRAFDFGAGDESDPIVIGWYRVIGDLLLWEGWESEHPKEEVQDHERE